MNRRGQLAQRHTRLAEKEHSIQRERIFVYRDGTLVREEAFRTIDQFSLLRFIPIVGAIRMIRGQYKTLKRSERVFLQALGPSQYRKQFAFIYGHKVPDRTGRGYFASSPLIKFSLPHLLKELETFSSRIQGTKKNFDLLFLGYCLSSIETIYTVFEWGRSLFTLASPELIPLVGLTELDLISLGNHLKDEDTQTTVRTWLQKSFDPYAKENVSNKVMASHYILSLYDMEQLKLLSEDFLYLVDTLKDLRRRGELRTEKDFLETLASTGERSSSIVDFINLPNYDCHNHPVLEELIIPLSPAVSYFYQKKSFIDILLDRGPSLESSHSGFSCI